MTFPSQHACATQDTSAGETRLPTANLHATPKVEPLSAPNFPPPETQTVPSRSSAGGLDHTSSQGRIDAHLTGAVGVQTSANQFTTGIHSVPVGGSNSRNSHGGVVTHSRVAVSGFNSPTSHLVIVDQMSNAGGGFFLVGSV